MSPDTGPIRFLSLAMLYIVTGLIISATSAAKREVRCAAANGLRTILQGSRICGWSACVDRLCRGSSVARP